eukprot:scaffold14709_cov91-Cyclotella_meneghiniana.AAC.1
MSSMLRSAAQSASNQFIRPSTTSANARNGILARLQEELHPEIISSGTYERFICAVEREDKQAIGDLLIQAMNIDDVALEQLLYALDGYKQDSQEAGHAAESSEVDVGSTMPGQDVKMAVDGNHSRPSHALVAGGDMMEDHTPRDGAGGDEIPASVTVVSHESHGTGKVSEMMDTDPLSSAAWPPAEDHLRSEGEPPLTRPEIIKSMRGLLRRFRTCTLDGEMAPGHSTLGKTTKKDKPVVQGPAQQKQSAKKDDEDSANESEDEQNDGSGKGDKPSSGGSGNPGMQYGPYIADEPDDGLEEWYVDLDPPQRKPPAHRVESDEEDEDEMDEDSAVDPWDIVWEGWLAAERLAVLSWFCHAVKRLRWRPQDVCLQTLRPSHFEDLKTQMKKEADKKLIVADLGSRDDLPSADKKGPGSSLPHLCIKLMQFLNENYGESGLPLAYVVRDSITRPEWKSFMGGEGDDDPRASSKGTAIDFFDFENFDKYMVRLADILTPEANRNVLQSTRPTTRDEYENGRRNKRTAQFKRDEAMVLSLLVHVFKDTHLARSYFPTAGAMKDASGRKVYRDIVGNFLGDDYLRKEAQSLKEVLRQAQYNVESRNYNWDTHVAKFLNGITQLTDLRSRLPAGISGLTNEELIICFLESIKETCDNDELKVARTMIHQNLKDYPDVASVASKLRMNVTNWRTGGSSGGGGTKPSATLPLPKEGVVVVVGEPTPINGTEAAAVLVVAAVLQARRPGEWGKMKLTSDKKGQVCAPVPGGQSETAVCVNDVSVPIETETSSSQNAVRTVMLRSRHVGLARSYDKTKVRVELDSHDDTSVVGNNVLVLREHTRHVNVTGFDPTVPHRQCKVVDCAVRYVSHEDGSYKLLVINQAILVPELEHCLLCPMQCRMNGVEINECPRFLTSDPTDSTHSIIVHDPEDPAHTLHIPLRLDGVISHFECETPPMEEVQGDQYPCYELTASGPEWDPGDPSFGSQEDSWLDYRGRSIAPARRYDYQGAGAGPPPSSDDDKENESPLWNLSQVSLQYDAADVTDKDNFVTALESTVRVALVETSEPGVQEMQCGSTTTGKRRGAVDYITLANRWNIPLEKAKRTVRATTQRGVRTCLHPTLSRRFATNDRMLRYHRMPCNLYGDTLYVKDKYKSNTAEREIRELKKGAARQMTARGAPLKTWDWALELESFIRSHSAHNIYQLNGRVPETIVSGETADISPYCEYGFWQWVMFREPKASEHGTFPEDARLLGKYLGPAIDTGGAMTARIMKGNGEVVDRSTLRGLTPAEVIDAEHCKRRDEFLKVIHQKYGAKTKDSDLGPDGLNLVEGDVHELYEEVTVSRVLR